jgi:hypothetical protein
MQTRLSKLATLSEGRYLTRDEQQDLLGFASALPQRVKVAELVEQKEDGIVRALTEEMKRRYPNFPKYHDQAWAKCNRDVTLVLRYDVQAMVFDDMKMLEDKVLYWLRTILAASNFTPQFVRDCYTILRDLCRQQLPPDAYRALEPYLERNISVVSDFPEPVTPAV